MNVVGLVAMLGFLGYAASVRLSQEPRTASTQPSAPAGVVPSPHAFPSLPKSAPMPALAPTREADLVVVRLLVVNGKLSSGVVDSILTGSSARLQRCNDRTVREKRMRVGRAKIRFVIELDGTVRDATLESASPVTPELRACIEDAVNQLSFPRPDEGTATVEALTSWL